MTRFQAIRSRLIPALLAVMPILALASCSSTTEVRTGQLSLMLTDAPGDVVSAVVTIDRIYLQPADDEDNEGRIILLEEDVTTDLLTLVDDLEELIADFEIPVGTYRGLRFVISGAYIEVEQVGGSTKIYASSPTYAGLPDDAVVDGNLQMPSLAQSGLKITLPGNAVVIDEDEETTLIIDFDVAASFGQLAGQSGNWVMHPVIHATVPDGQ
jgi:hypothetical protein